MKDYEKLTEKLFGLINNLKELIPPNEERQKDYEALEKVATDIAAEFDDMERCIDEMVQDQKQHEKELKDSADRVKTAEEELSDAEYDRDELREQHPPADNLYDQQKAEILKRMGLHLRLEDVERLERTCLNNIPYYKRNHLKSN